MQTPKQQCAGALLPPAFESQRCAALEYLETDHGGNMCTLEKSANATQQSFFIWRVNG